MQAIRTPTSTPILSGTAKAALALSAAYIFNIANESTKSFIEVPPIDAISSEEKNEALQASNTPFKITCYATLSGPVLIALLVDFISSLASESTQPTMQVLETLPKRQSYKNGLMCLVYLNTLNPMYNLFKNRLIDTALFFQTYHHYQQDVSSSSSLLFLLMVPQLIVFGALSPLISTIETNTNKPYMLSSTEQHLKTIQKGSGPQVLHTLVNLLLNYEKPPTLSDIKEQLKTINNKYATPLKTQHQDPKNQENVLHFAQNMLSEIKAEPSYKKHHKTLFTLQNTFNPLDSKLILTIIAPMIQKKLDKPINPFDLHDLDQLLQLQGLYLEKGS